MIFSECVPGGGFPRLLELWGLLCDNSLLPSIAGAQFQGNAAAVHPGVAQYSSGAWGNSHPGSCDEAEFLVLVRHVAAL